MRSARAIALVLTILGGFAGSAAGNGDPEGGTKPLETRTRILASLLAGNWVDNEYFTEADFERLRLMRFRSASVVLDHAVVERIVDPHECQVERTWFDMSGNESRSETVALSCDDFWARVRYVEDYQEKSGVLPVSPVDLSLVRSSPATVSP